MEKFDGNPGRALTIEEIGPADIEICRPLCDELMKFQKSKAFMFTELFDSMNFDTRMKPSYEGALERYVAVARDGGEAVGYAFSTIDDGLAMKAAKSMALPPWDEIPAKLGHFNNFFLREPYRKSGLGKKLFLKNLDWLKSFPDVEHIFTYVSNGNDYAFNFYERHGFTFSHDVAGGFIKALYLKNAFTFYEKHGFTPDRDGAGAL
jgi:GNAT superfamily N-acetyltransferase